MIKMNEEKITISVNQEDVQNIINCYEKDLKELNQLQNNWNELKKWLEDEVIKKEEHFNFVIQNYNPLRSDVAPQLEKTDLIISKLNDVLDKMQELEGNNE